MACLLAVCVCVQYIVVSVLASFQHSPAECLNAGDTVSMRTGPHTYICMVRLALTEVPLQRRDCEFRLLTYLMAFGPVVNYSKFQAFPEYPQGTVIDLFTHVDTTLSASNAASCRVTTKLQCHNYGSVSHTSWSAQLPSVCGSSCRQKLGTYVHTQKSTRYLHS